MESCCLSAGEMLHLLFTPNVHNIIIVRVYIVVYRHTGISLQPYTQLRNIYFKMQKKMKMFNLIYLFQ